MSASIAAVEHRFIASAEDAGRRLDLYLASRLSEVSRTRIQELVDAGKVLVNGRLPRRAHRLTAGETVEIAVVPRPAPEASAENIPLELLYEDDDLVVVNKPAGMVVHAGAGATRGTLVNALLHRFGELSGTGGNLRPGIVHRLDRGTSGAIAVARNDAAHESLAEQFRTRTIKKTYITLVHGRLSRDAGSIILPIARDPRRRTRMTARLRSGRAAQTDWQALLQLGNFTLVAAQPRTGRTHQIRAHFAAIGHPLVGDTLYGAPERPRVGRTLLAPLGRVFLHAAMLEFAHPRSGQPLSVRAPFDRGLRAYLGELGRAAQVDPRRVDDALRGYL